MHDSTEVLIIDVITGRIGARQVLENCTNRDLDDPWGFV